MTPMIHTIKSGSCSAQICEVGAELFSFKNDTTGQEYIWQRDPLYWIGSAPILFPIVGGLKEGEYVYKGQKYTLPKHGFARNSLFALQHDDGKTKKTFILKSDQITKKCFPFDFELVVVFEIEETTLQVTYRVKNTGEDVMYFTLGSHPAFALPVDDCSLSDYFIEFEKNETLPRYKLQNDLLNNTPIPCLKNEKRITLNETIFNEDALIFKNIRSRKLSIHHSKTGHRISLETGGAPHLGIWAKPGAPYVCLEPWYSYADSVESTQDFMEKPGILKLSVGAKFETHYSIEI